MKLIFEKSKAGVSCSVLPLFDVPDASLSSQAARKKPPCLPWLDENQISRHYSREIAGMAFLSIYREIQEDGESLHNAPRNTVIGRPDEVKAARQPVLRYTPS